ncbi:UDP-N-acetylmuramate dehydrogenase [Candidatus Falkowbacteria bacterium]|nr:UDP-N-acetylmuramate dehydrogenase [Candidatus Falkowbacteria bacterium]
MIDKLKEKLGEGVLENEPLASHCTFKIGGPAKYFFIAKNSDEVVNATKVAMKLGIKFFVLSGGSNVLFADTGFDGLVVKVNSSWFMVHGADCKIETDAGVKLAEVVKAAAENGLSGLEWAAGIPGTVGGAVRGNAGAYGHAMGESVESVEAIKVSSFKFQVSSYNKEECRFGYRDSIFKREGGIILKVVLKLATGDKKKIKEEMNKILKARDGKIPTDSSAGSFFKNVEVTDEIVKTIKEYTHEDIPADFISRGKIPAAWLIEQCDLKGKQVGGAKVSEKHANFIVNAGGATAGDVVALASLVKTKVRNETGVQLNEEIEYVGF